MAPATAAQVKSTLLTVVVPQLIDGLKIGFTVTVTVKVLVHIFDPVPEEAVTV